MSSAATITTSDFAETSIVLVSSKRSLSGSRVG
jgi:hypothetical protein